MAYIYAMESFFDRHKAYEDAYDYQIIKRLPIIVSCDIRSAHRITKKLKKPYCPIFLDIMASTLLHTTMEIDGAVFGYHHNDEFTIVLTPNDNPWYQNKIQKLCSIISSITTISFYKNILTEKSILNELDGDVIFDVKIFAVPSITEAVNNLILKQQICIHDSISRAALSELTKTYDKSIATKKLYGKKINEKIDVLMSECHIDYNEYYPPEYRNGLAVYKVPHIEQTKEGEITKNKWLIDCDIPLFALDKNFVSNILYSGHDVFRADRDLETK